MSNRQSTQLPNTLISTNISLFIALQNCLNTISNDKPLK